MCTPHDQHSLVGSFEYWLLREAKTYILEVVAVTQHNFSAMATQTLMIHSGGVSKTAYTGWSWSVFFFGPLPALFRGDLKYFLILVIGHFVLAFTTFGIGNIVLSIAAAVKYNAWHRSSLIEKGYRSQEQILRDIDATRARNISTI